MDAAEFEYLSCNFCHEENGATGETVAKGWKMLEAKGEKIAFIGITTPETITSSTPKYFMDDAGNFIYGFHRDADGSALYAVVQKNIDEAKAVLERFTSAGGTLGFNVKMTLEVYSSQGYLKLY